MMAGEYRHPLHDVVAALLRSGATVREAASATGAARSAVQRVRHLEGIEGKQRAIPVADKLAASVVTVQGTDHVAWTGFRNNGTPVIRHRGREMSAAAVVYETHHGRLPNGMVKSECHTDGSGGPEHCMNPVHLGDEDDRQRERAQMRALLGLEAPAGVCAAGHDQRIYGKIEPSLKVYCGPCATERRAANRRMWGR